ncbi:MAG: type III-A CRISPR-associated protein Csm2 [Dysgonamonadaceae bacterium]
MNILVLNPTDTGYNEFLLEETENFVKNKLNGMTKTQLRNVFELIRNCNSADELKITKPKLLYTAGRLNGEAKKFLLKLSILLSAVSMEEHVNLVKKFIETVLAYHKYHAKN